MLSEEIRRRFLEFFKARGHVILPSAPLVPENDPTVLFITAGMQPLVPYLMGRPHPAGRRLANIQKCVRTVDIDSIGDATHNTFFEMMGNWSLGDYFKEEAIEWSYQLLTDKTEGFGFDPTRLYITVYAGDTQTPRDTEAAGLWQAVGIKTERIYYLGADSNWWPNVKGLDDWTGPTGPSSEMFYDLTEAGLGDLTHEQFLQADREQKIVEIWNDVFMTYEKKNGVIVGELTHKNVDTGAGLERLAMVLQKKDNIFETDLFSPIMAILNQVAPTGDLCAKRIVADHVRTAVFILADNVVPANTDRGYVLRRLVRRVARFGQNLGLTPHHYLLIITALAEKYQKNHSNIMQNVRMIEKEFLGEINKFNQTLEKGIKQFAQITASSAGEISGTEAFRLFTTYGFPLDLTVDLAKEKGLSVDTDAFNREFVKHQKLSRAAAEKKFKGGLADTTEMSVKYHTATHLLHRALREVLGPGVIQKGSNITPERLRFDFSFDRKLTDEEKRRVTEIVNQKIQANLAVKCEIMPQAEAKKTGAYHFFGEKYGDQVSIYYIGDSLASAWSKEFCGGPHTESTGGLGQFRIVKEEAVAAGTRRIKAVLE